MFFGLPDLNRVWISWTQDCLNSENNRAHPPSGEMHFEDDSDIAPVEKIDEIAGNLCNADAEGRNLRIPKSPLIKGIKCVLSVPDARPNAFGLLETSKWNSQ